MCRAINLFAISVLAAGTIATSASADGPGDLLGHASGETGGGYRIGGIQSKDHQQVYAAAMFLSGNSTQRALNLLNPLVERKFAPAMTLLGSMYIMGRGVDYDPVKATKLLAGAAEVGEARAMYLYAYALDNGLGTARDSAAASLWLQRASDSGVPEIQKAARAYRKQKTG